MAKTSEIRRRFWLAAQHTAALYGYNFAPDCRQHFQDFIKEGVDKIVAENHRDDEILLALAEANVTAFTMQMIVNARDLNLPRLHEPTFFGAKGLICPLWPFC